MNNKENIHQEQLPSIPQPRSKRRHTSVNSTSSVSSLTESHNKSIIRERDAQILALRKEVLALKNHLAKLNHKPNSKRSHKLTPYGNIIQQRSTTTGVSSTTTTNTNAVSSSPSYGHERSSCMSRNASIGTAEELSFLSSEQALKNQKQNESLVHRILDMFKDPTNPTNMNYLESFDFAKDVLMLNAKVRTVFESEPRVVFLQSPAYVFGDIHGNLEDLHFFSDNIWRLGMALTAGNFVFLGDYVDRGMSCIECVSYLFAMKLLLPHKVFLLRGNHETRDVNGWEEHYGTRSFIAQCRTRWGDDLGYKVWESTNQVFDRLPLAAVIDQDIFCVHGGIPRSIEQEEDKGKKRRVKNSSRVQEILKVPKVAGINPPYEHELSNYQQVASDCIWSDPASAEQELKSVNPVTGYGESLRGGGAICFGQKAVTDFLYQHNFSYIMRAHEAHADGVAVSKGGKVFTIFSTSKDHHQGNEAMAGCILVDFEQMQVINRSPAYKNQYVHRRDSVSVESLTEVEIERRMQLGLVTASSEEDEDEYNGEKSDHEYEEEEWEDMIEEDDEEEENGSFGDCSDDSSHYTLSNRKSSVDPIQTIASPPEKGQSNMHFEFVDTLDRKKKRNCRFSMIPEEDSSTLNGEEEEEEVDKEEENDQDTMDFDDAESEEQN